MSKPSVLLNKFYTQEKLVNYSLISASLSWEKGGFQVQLSSANLSQWEGVEGMRWETVQRYKLTITTLVQAYLEQLLLPRT
jgi:hypothetical protein